MSDTTSRLRSVRQHQRLSIERANRAFMFRGRITRRSVFFFGMMVVLASVLMLANRLVCRPRNSQTVRMLNIQQPVRRRMTWQRNRRESQKAHELKDFVTHHRLIDTKLTKRTRNLKRSARDAIPTSASNEDRYTAQAFAGDSDEGAARKRILNGILPSD